MKRCTRKILLIFGFLLLLVIVFIPYRSTHIKYQIDPHSLASYKITSQKIGYMFVIQYLKLRSQKMSVPQESDPKVDHDSYVLNKILFLAELIIIMVLAPFDYFLFCVILRKKSASLSTQINSEIPPDK